MNHKNKILINLFLFNSKIIRASSFVFIAAAFIVSGFFMPNSALAAATVNPASGGTNISVDTAFPDGSGAFTSLDGPAIIETATGDISKGTHTITLPEGWEFNTSSDITINKAMGNIVLGITTVTPLETSFSFEVASPSTNASILVFEGLQVRPTDTTPNEEDDITHSGAPIAGVTDGSTNFGTLSTVPGTVTKLAFTEQPSNTEYGSVIAPNPTVVTRDQFGNNSTSGLVETEMVSMTLSGGGVLTGMTPRNIGTGGDNGTVTFDDLKAKPIGTYTLTASSPSLASDVSGTFNITQKPLTATATVDGKDYDGNTSTANLNVVLVGKESGDTVTADLTEAVATFVSANAGTHAISVTGVTLTGDDAGNYTLADGDIIGTGTINPLEITITPTADQSKVYGEDDPAFTFAISVGELVAEETLGGSLSRAPSEDVGTYAIGIGTLQSANPNYAITFVAETFGITKRPITVEATASSKIYDGNTTSSGIPTITVGTLAAGDEPNFTQVYSTTNVAMGKKLTSSGTVGGNGGNNYEYIFNPKMNGAITEKELTVSGFSVADKVYDGNTNTIVNGVPALEGKVGSDDVSLTGTAGGSFNDPNVGSRTVAVSGLSLDGAAMGNYSLTQPVLGAEITTLDITGSFTADNKTYDGTTNATVLTRTLNGVLPQDEADVSLVGGTASFATRNVGDNITVTANGMTLSGPASGNYNLISVGTTVANITKKTINVTAQTDTKTYDGTTDSDVSPVVDELEEDDTVTTVPSQSYDTKDVSTGKTLSVNEGELVINDGNDGNNYDVTFVDNTAGVIEAKELTVVNVVSVPKIYNGDIDAEINFGGASLQGIVGTEDVVPNSDVSGVIYSATYNNKNVGTGKQVTVSGLTLDGAGASNYSLTQPILNDGVITPRIITIVAATDTKTYDGTTDSDKTPAFVVEELFGDTHSFTQSYNSPGAGDDKVLTATGIVNDGNEGNNYIYDFTNTAIGAITKAPLSITADNQKREYGDANPLLTATYVGFVGEEDESVLNTPVLLATLAGATSPVGTYEITASGAEDNNYEITHNNGTLTVTPAPLTIEPDEGQSKIYGGPSEEITYTATGFKNEEDETIFTDALLGREPGENAGDYLITKGTLDVGDNYFVVDSFFDIFYTIKQRPLTVTAVTDTKTYDGDTTSNGIPTITGDLQFDDIPAFTQSFNSSDVGSDKVLMASGVVNDENGGANYTYDFSNTDVGEITPLEIVITPDAEQNKVYGEDDPVFTYTFSPNLIGGDEFTDALSRVAGENVGTYAYTLGTLSAGGNYNLSLGGSNTFAITKAAPVITWGNPADITYGAALDGTELNATADVGGTFVYTPVLGTILNAGNGQTLSVTFTPTDTLNYENETTEVLINVTKASLTVTAENKSKEYLADDPALTFTVEGLVNGDTNAVFSGALEREEGELAETYAILQGTLLAGNNYNINYTQGTFTIEDTVMPSVVSRTPSLNALNISPTTAIVVTFSEAVDVEEEDVSFDPEISGGFTISDSGTNVVTITPVSPLDDNTTYTITLDGVEDVNDNPLPTYSNIKFTTATIYSINLDANGSGWNLISLPVVPSNTAIAAVLGSAADNIDAVWTYDPTNPNAVNGWLVYTGNPSTSNLDKMTAGFGYWMSVTDDANLSGSGTLLIAGPTPPPSRSLQTGWNLIGYYQLPDESSSIPTKAFASLGGSYTGLWGFDNATGFFKSVGTILPGEAFWISLPSVKNYTPSNI